MRLVSRSVDWLVDWLVVAQGLTVRYACAVCVCVYSKLVGELVTVAGQSSTTGCRHFETIF